MNHYYVDMHIHIGRTLSGKPVKITGAKSLTFSNIIEVASGQKGLDIVGIIDCHSPEVILEIEQLIADRLITEHEEGGLQYGPMTIIPGSELEIYDENCHGPIHVLCYFPTVKKLKKFSAWLSVNLKNVQLSSQRIYVSGRELQCKVKQLDGLFIPAHVFTPFKSLYGKGVINSLTEVFDPHLIDGIELGLSSDTNMAKELPELQPYPFLTNSDAHSLPKIAREYQIMALKKPTFTEFKRALQNKSERRIVANYGLNPLLGKYYKTVCHDCEQPLPDIVLKCPNCSSKKIVKGVANRIAELCNSQRENNVFETGAFCQGKFTKQNNPPYIHQVPLDFIPGLGPKTLERLLDHFGTEMAILHEVPAEALQQVVTKKISEYILLARSGKLSVSAGGGGRYGKVTTDKQ